MKAKASNGWFYIEPYQDHPLIQPYRKKYGRFSMRPETVIQVFNDIPVLKTLLPEAWDWYSLWVKNLSRIKEIKALKASDINIKHPWIYPPMDHQMVSLAFSLWLPACGLFLEPGCGKTYISTLNVEIRKRKGIVKRALVIAPSSVLQVGWVDDIYKFTKLRPIVLHNNASEDFWCPISNKWISRVSNSYVKSIWRDLNALDGKTVKRKDTDPERYYSLIPDSNRLRLNDIYRKTSVEERLALDYDIYITSFGMTKRLAQVVEPGFFDQIIVDESTRLRNPTSSTTKAIHKLGYGAKFRMILTGTPIGNHLEDIWSQMYFLDQSLGPTFGSFISKYFWTHPQHFYIRNPLNGASKDIEDRIKDRVIVYKKDDCLDLPDQIFINRHTKLNVRQTSLYKTMEDEFFALLEAGEEAVAETAMAQTQKLQQITGGFLHTQDYKGETSVEVFDPTPPKLKCVKEIIENEIEKNEKVIIWAVYKQDIQNLLEHLKEYNPVLLRTKGISASVSKFENDETCRVAVSHPRSCKFGITLNRSNYTIYYSIGYSAEDYTQSLARNYRKGQKKKVTVYHMIGSPIDQAIFDSVTTKRDFSSQMLRSIKKL